MQTALYSQAFAIAFPATLLQAGIASFPIPASIEGKDFYFFDNIMARTLTAELEISNNYLA
jgi:hypothetical protein